MIQNKKYSFLFVSAPFSGVEVFMKNVHQSLKEDKKIESHWIWLDRKLGLVGFKQSILNFINWTFKSGYFTFIKIRELERQGKKFDAVFFNHVTPVTMLKKFRKRIPTVLSLDTTPILLDRFAEFYQHNHNYFFPYFVKRQGYKLTKKVYSDVAYILAWSKIVKKSLIEDYDVPEEKIVVLPPGVDIEKWKIGERDYDKEKRNLKVLFVGGEFLRKGGDILLEVASERRFQNIEFHFVTKTFIGKKGPNIFVYDDIEPNSDRILDIYHNSDLMILPTRADFSPTNAICEAMATGLPVISTNVGGLDEIVQHGVTGYIIEVGSKDSLGTALEQLAQDNVKRSILGQNARKLVEERYNIKHNAEEIISYLILAANCRPL